MAKNKTTVANHTKVAKTKKETILIELLPSTDIKIDESGQAFVNGFKHIGMVYKYGKTYAKCINEKIEI